MPFEEGLLHRDWYRAVQEGTPNDFVICVTASSKTPVSGTGKTTLQTHLGEKTDLSDEGFIAEKTASLDAGELAYKVVPEVDSHRTVVFDEAQGAPGTTGLDARRAMKQEVIDAVSSILANRDKQLTIIIGAQQFSTLDPRIYPIVDAWLLIRLGPSHPEGPVGTYHKVHVEDYNLSNPKVKTPAVEDFTWPRVNHNNPNYRHLDKLKQEAKTRGSGEDDEGQSFQSVDDMPIQVRNDEISRLYDCGITQRKIADIFGLNQSTVSGIING
jgi:hypothetical protein